MEKYSELIQLSRFLPSTTNPNILDALYEEHPILSNKMEDFLNLPVNEEYKKNQEKKQKEETITVELKEEKEEKKEEN